MSEQSEQLKERTLAFAVAILAVVDRFPTTTAAQVVGRQLARSATSMGSNYRAACTARSRPEFIAKLCIVHEEADETAFWLEVTSRGHYIPAPGLEAHMGEAVELRAIFGRSLATARQNLRSNRPDRRPAHPVPPIP